MLGKSVDADVTIGTRVLGSGAIELSMLGAGRPEVAGSECAMDATGYAAGNDS